MSVPASAAAEGAVGRCGSGSLCPDPSLAPLRAAHGDQRLIAAARDGDFKKIRRLLQKHRVNVNARDPSTGNTALMVAGLVQDPDAMSELLQHGADPTLHSYTGQNCLDSLPGSLVQLVLGFPDYLLRESASRSNEERRLLLSAWSGQTEEVHRLLSQTGGGGLDVNCTNVEGSTPLILVCRDLGTFQELATTGVLRSYDPLGVIRVLLDHGILIHRDVNHQDRQGRTALHYASHTCCEHTAAVVSLLLQNGAKVDIKDKHGFSPLHFASQAGSVEAIQLLLDAGADPSAMGLGAIAPLHLAASAGNTAAVRVLLEHGADVLSFSHDGKSPLCCAGSADVYGILRRAFESALCERADKLKISPLEQEKKKLGQLILQSRHPESFDAQSSPGSSTGDEEGSSSSDKEPSEPEAEAVLKTRPHTSSSAFRSGDVPSSAFRRYQPAQLLPRQIPGWRQKSPHGSHFVPVRPRDPSSDEEGRGLLVEVRRSIRDNWGLETEDSRPAESSVSTLENNSYHRQKTMPSNSSLEQPHVVDLHLVEQKNKINMAPASGEKSAENTEDASPQVDGISPKPQPEVAWVFGESSESVAPKDLKDMYARVRPSSERRESGESESGEEDLKRSSRKRPVASRRRKTQHYSKNYHLSRFKLRPETGRLGPTVIPDVTAVVVPTRIASSRPLADSPQGPAAEDVPYQRPSSVEHKIHSSAAHPKFSLLQRSKEGGNVRLNGSRMLVPSKGLMSKFLPPWVTRDDVSSHLSSASWVYLPSLLPEEAGEEIKPRLSLPRKEEQPPSHHGSLTQVSETKANDTMSNKQRAEGTHTLTCARRETLQSEGSAFHTVSGKGGKPHHRSEPKVVPPLPKSLHDIPAFPAGPPFPWIKGKLIGKGAFGLVWCGLRKSGGELVAVKQFQLGPPDVLSAVQLEVDILQSLKHPNIVGFLGVQQEDTQGVVNLFLEFISGGSLSGNLAQFGSFPETVVRRYGRQLLQALAYLHQRNVIHRDIKGNNVMVCPSTGTIKLIDFGCATFEPSAVDCEGLVASARGTPYWMAPEVICQEECSHKSDVWSVGCTVIEMFQTKPPWYELSPLAAAFAIGQGTSDPKFPENLSPDARDFIQCCLKRSPAERPTAEELLNHKFLQSGGIESL